MSVFFLLLFSRRNSNPTYMVIQSMGLNPVTYSSSWHELSGNFISISSRMKSSIGKSFCRKSSEHTAGTQRPNVRAVPFFGLEIVNVFIFLAFVGKTQIYTIYNSYCCAKNGANRGTNWLWAIWLSIVLRCCNFGDAIPFKSNSTCPMQYFVGYNPVFRSMWKHSENVPKS